MSDNKQLEQQLWNIANTLRGKMDADEFRDYILGFIFYKYLSEKMRLLADKLLSEDNIKYIDINENTSDGKELLDAIRDDAIDSLGYFLKPSELFSSIVKRTDSIIEELETILRNIEQSTMDSESADDFGNLFEDVDLNSTKLGKDENLLHIEDSEDIEEAFDNYWGEQKLAAFNKLCKEEKLNENKIQAIIEEYLFANQITSLNEKVDDALIERETLLIRKKTVKRVIEKIMSFIETFVDDLAA